MNNNRKFKNKLNVIGKQIKNCRKENNLTIQELSDKLMLIGIDIPKNSLQRLENGNRIIKDYELAGISKILNVSVDLLLKDFKFDNDIIILFDNSKEKIIKKIIKEKDFFCFIGNNYFNDIYTSYKFNIKSVYVGKSKFVKKLKKVKLSCDNIFEALDILSEEV